MSLFGKRNEFPSDVVLGDRYRDTQTGVEGVATSITFFQHACERVGLETLNKDREIKEYIFDAPRLVRLDSGEAVTTDRPGGARNTPTAHSR